MIQTKLKTSDLISISEKKNLSKDFGDKTMALAAALLQRFPDSQYKDWYGNKMRNDDRQPVYAELSNMDNGLYRKYDENLFNNILQVLEISEDQISNHIQKIPDPNTESIHFSKQYFERSIKAKETHPKNVEPEKQVNTNLKSNTMTPEQLREKYPEACNIIFKAGMRAGMEAQQGKLPEPGTNPEFDNLNAEVDKVLNQTKGKGPEQLTKRLAE